MKFCKFWKEIFNKLDVKIVQNSYFKTTVAKYKQQILIPES